MVAREVLQAHLIPTASGRLPINKGAGRGVTAGWGVGLLGAIRFIFKVVTIYISYRR